MLGFLTSSGILAKTHVFYEQIHSFCTRAMGLVEEQLLPEMYPALYQFQQALQTAGPFHHIYFLVEESMAMVEVIIKHPKNTLTHTI